MAAIKSAATKKAVKDTEKGELSYTPWGCKLEWPVQKQRYRMEVPEECENRRTRTVSQTA